MDRRNYSDIEDEIMQALQRTFDSIDIAGIKQEVKGRAESAFFDAKDSIKNGTRTFNKKMSEASSKYNEFKNKRKNKIVPKNSQYIAKNPKGKVKGILYTIFGTMLTVVFGILTLVSLIGSSVVWVAMAAKVCVVLFAGSAAMTLRGSVLRKKIRRFKEYVNYIDGRNYCSIKEIAEKSSRKENLVVKDLNHMINAKMFLEGHIDEENECFVLGNDIYNEYLKAKESLRKRSEEEEKRKKIQEEEDLKNPQNKEARRIINEGKQYIEAIRNANDYIEGEEISKKLDKLENIVTEIFKHLEKNPNKVVYVNKFVNHYLPITLKLVNSYKELNNQPVQGQNITKAKNEIEETLDMINSAFEKLLDDLFEDVALDISTDISVLQTLFNQEGLTEDDFHKQ